MRLRPALVLAAALVVTIGCRGSDDPVTAARDGHELPADQIMFDVQYDVRDVGVLRARLVTDTAFLFEDSAKVLLRPIVSLVLYDEAGRETADLTANEGWLDTRTQAMIARGDVALVGRENGRRIETQELHFNPQANRIWSDVETTLTEGDTRVRGEGFTSDAQMRDVRIRRGTAEKLEIEF